MIITIIVVATVKKLYLEQEETQYGDADVMKASCCFTKHIKTGFFRRRDFCDRVEVIIITGNRRNSRVMRLARMTRWRHLLVGK